LASHGDENGRQAPSGKNALRQRQILDQIPGCFHDKSLAKARTLWLPGLSTKAVDKSVSKVWMSAANARLMRAPYRSTPFYSLQINYYESNTYEKSQLISS